MERAGQGLYSLIRGFLTSRWGIGIALAWGFFEATVFFLIPDVYLGFAGLFFPICGLIFCLWSIVGSILGGAVMFALGQAFPDFMLNVLSHVPGISGKMIAAVQSDIASHGINAILIAPWQGIPYKIYAVVAGMSGSNLGYFLLVTVPARLERFILSLLIALALGLIFRVSIARYPRRWLWGYVLVWVLIYAQYIYSVYQRWGG